MNDIFALAAFAVLWLGAFTLTHCCRSLMTVKL
jgi:hypothetical protein